MRIFHGCFFFEKIAWQSKSNVLFTKFKLTITIQFNLQKKISDSFGLVRWMFASRKPRRPSAISWASATATVCNMETITWIIVCCRLGAAFQCHHLMPYTRLGARPTTFHRWFFLFHLLHFFQFPCAHFFNNDVIHFLAFHFLMQQIE